MMNEWNENISRTICTSLLKAVSGPDVKKVMDDYAHFFNNEENWHPYGDNRHNWGVASNQQSDPLGALLEIIMNGFDAVLMKAYNQKRLKNPSYKPENMKDMIRDAFNIRGGELGNLEEKQLGELADKIVQVGIKRAKNSTRFPTYTVIDFAEGQSPDKFLKSFLSMNAGNKKGLFFVQGRHNQGSLGSIPHCTQGDIKLGGYKLILSKRIHTDQWGWTLIRVILADKEHRDPRVVYFAPLPNKTIASFKQDESISAFDHPKIGRIEQGTIVKLYEYAISPGNNQKGEGLRNGLTRKLITSPLPVRIYDFDAEKLAGEGQHSELRKEGIYSTIFSGLKNMLASYKTRPGGGKKQHKELGVISLGEIIQGDIGKILVEAYPKFEMPDYISRSNQVAFYTFNGQTHGVETEGFLNKCDLGELRGHLVVNIICDDMDPNLNLFKADRERIQKGKGSRIIQTKVLEKLKDSERLKNFQKQVEAREAKKIDEDEALQKKLLEEYHSEAFLSGDDLPGSTLPPIPSPEPPPYEGKKFPTYIKLERKKLAQNSIDIRINKPRKIIFLCDAVDDYLGREQEHGKIVFDSNIEIDCNPGELSRGHIPVTFLKGAEIKVGDEVRCKFGFEDVNHPEPLVCEFTLKFIKEESFTSAPPNPQPNNIKKKKLPKIIWVEAEDPKWNKYNFNQRTGAVIVKGESLAIYVNKENLYLKHFSKRLKNRLYIETLFRYGVALVTLDLYEGIQQKEDSDSNDDVDFKAMYRLSSDAITKNIIPIARLLCNLEKNLQQFRETTSEEEAQSDLEETQNDLLDDT